MAIVKEVNIAGQQVKLAYCYATEIIFSDLTGKDFAAFMRTSSDNLALDPKNVLYAIIAAAMAYSESAGESCPISDKQIMFEATNEEVAAALKAVLDMFVEWYHLPVTEEKAAKKKGTKGKN